MAELSEKPTAYAVFEPVLSRWDPDRLERAAADVATLADHPGYKVLFDVLGEKRQKEMDRLVFGPVLPQANYAAITGTLSGLDSVLHIIAAVQHAHERSQQQERKAAEAAERKEKTA